MPIEKQTIQPFVCEFTSYEDNCSFDITLGLSDLPLPNVRVYSSESINYPYFDYKDDVNEIGSWFLVNQMYEILPNGSEKLVDPEDPSYSNLFIDGCCGSVQTKIPKGLYNTQYSTDAIIDWGDGTIDVVKNALRTSSSIETLSDGKQYKIVSFLHGANSGTITGHEYNESGTYRIKIYYMLGCIALLPRNKNIEYRVINWGDVKLLHLSCIINGYSGGEINNLSQCKGIPKITETVARNLICLDYIGPIVMEFLNEDFSFLTYDMPILSTAHNMFLSGYFNNENAIVCIPSNAFTKAPNLIDISYMFNRIIIKKLIVGDNFCKGCVRLYNNTLWSVEGSKNISISIGDGFLQNCVRLVYDYSNISGNVEKVGKDFMRGCTWLTSVNTLRNLCLPVEVGEGMFRECPNLRSVAGCFYGISGSLTLPNNLFIDLHAQTGRTKDILYLPNFTASNVESWNNKSDEELDNVFIKFGENMLPEDFMNNGGIVLCCGSWSSSITYYDSNRNVRYLRSVCKGIAPPIWKYLNSISPDLGYYTDIDKIKTISYYISKKIMGTAFFGGATSSKNVQLWDNLSEIPGNYPRQFPEEEYPQQYNPDDWFLYPTEFLDSNN